MKFLLPFLLLAANLLPANAEAPIYYNRYTGNATSPTANLFLLDNGTDTEVPVALPEEAFPAISNAGDFLAVTSSDPASPAKVSRNAYLIDTSDHSTRLLVEYEDTTDPQSGSTRSELPVYKAFSPDDTYVGISSLVQITGGGLGGAATFPRLFIHTTSDGTVFAQVAAGEFRTGDYTEMAGVDWSPSLNQLVTPLRRDAPPQVGGQVTAIHRLLPISDAVGNGGSLQITFPGATSDGVSRSWQNDLLPFFSPDSSEVAFFRATQSITPSGKTQSICSLMRVNADGTNERVLATFTAGLYPTGLSWSPDGSQLVCGIAPQLFINGTYLNQGDLTQSELITIDVATGAASEIGAFGSAFPVWSPEDTGTGGFPTRVILTRNPEGGLILRTADADPTGNFTVESSTVLSGWGNQQGFTGAQLNAGIPVAIDGNRRQFRVTQP